MCASFPLQLPATFGTNTTQAAVQVNPFLFFTEATVS